MKFKELFGGLVGAFIAGIGTQLPVEYTYHVVSIISSIVGLLITITSAIIIPLIKWWRNARKDGKISNEELDNLSNILEDGKNAIDKNIKESGKEKNNGL